MQLKRLTFPAILLSTLALLSACGGSDTSPTTGSSTNLTPATAASTLTSVLTNALATLNLETGLNANFISDLFETDFFDGGVSVASLREVMTATISAKTTTPDLSMFPTVELSNSKVTDCNSSNICTFSATLTNKDTEDTTTVDFTTNVKVVGSSVRFYGDQSSTAP